MMERVDEMTSPPIIGRRYWVQCAFVPKSATVLWGWWPINGQKHDDAELGVPQRWGEAVLASILPSTVIRTGSEVTIKVADRRLTCRRDMPLFPRNRNPPWLPDLESRYADVVAKGCVTCPHRGLRLASLPVDERGVVTCAGHGLQWDRATGALVRERRVSP